MSDPLSVYLHIPFCKHRCAYCDFNTYAGLNDLQEAYVAMLAEEVRQVAPSPPRWVHTVFFGGGTPSLLPPAGIRQILESVRAHFTLAPDAEIAMEVNPGTVDADYLAAVRAWGVNRLSVGMQSARPGELTLLERDHTLSTVVDAVAAGRTAGFANISLDLIYGLPRQSLRDWETSLHAALALHPEHLSLYCLTIEPGTRMNGWLETGRIPAPDPDLAADQYELACDLLAEHGFVHYEISNWARPGRECEHNLTYWRNGEYLGLGAGAHGHAAGIRYQVVKQPRVYVRRLREGERGEYPLSAAVEAWHRPGREEQMSDTIITQLRLLQEGLDVPAFTARFGRSPHDVYGDTVSQLVEWGLLDDEGDRLRLSGRGRFLSNQVFYRFV